MLNPIIAYACHLSARGALLRGASVIALATGGALLAGPALAQTSYQGPTTDANWGDNANWTAGTPNAGSAAIVNNGQVVLTDGFNRTNTLKIGPVAGSGVTIQNNTILQVGGNVVNSGAINLSGGPSGTELRIAGGTTVNLSGGGTLTLSNSNNNVVRDADSANGKLVNFDNRIQGAGNIGNVQMSFDNKAAGLVDANQSNTLYLQMNGGGTTNEGMLRASAGGTLNIFGATVSNTGTVLATGAGSTVVLTTTSVTGGTLTTASGGAFATAGTNSINSLTLSTGSTFTGSNNTITYLGGTITNNGTLLLNASTNDTEFRVGGGSTTTLTGGGVLQLSDSGNNAVRDADATTGTLINVNNTIQGAGTFGNGQLGIVNQVGGTISATSTNSQLVLATNSQGLSNANLVQAMGGATLDIQNTAVTQTGAGTLLATGAGSTVLLSNSSVTGGTLTTASGGAFATAGTNSINSLTLSTGSTFTGSNNTITYLGGTITNNGTLLLNASTNDTEFRVGGGSTTTLTGGGVLQLSDSGNNAVRDADATTGTLINVNNTIQGAGTFGNGQLGIVNQVGGTISATSTNSQLVLATNSQGLSNANLVQAMGGATLDIQNTAVTQTGAGTLLATGAGSTVLLSNSSVTGGTLTTASGGAFATAGTNSINSLTLSTGSTFTGSNNTITYLGGTITNNGTLLLNASTNDTEFRVGGGSTTTLQGGGTVTLSNSGNNIIRDADAATGKLVNVDNTIQGAGTFGNGQLGIDNRLHGLIDANVSTTLYVRSNGPTLNAGTIRASAGGTLDLSSTTQSATGVILSTGAGSTVVLDNANITGGTLTTTGGGVMVTAGTTSLNSLTVSAGSTVAGSNNTVIYLGGTITNDGTLLLNATTNVTEFRVGGGSTTTLQGGGTVTLSNSANNIIRDADAATGKLVNVDNTIQGAGSFGNGQLTIVNGVSGTILANQTSALNVSTNGAGLTNNGVLQATAGATMNVQGGPLTNYSGGTLTGGTYRADANSTINLNTGGITTNAATIVLNGTGSALNTSAGAVETTLTTNAAGGVLAVLGGRNYTTTNAIGNAGTIQLGGGTFASNGLTNTGFINGFGTVAPTNGAPIANNGGAVMAAGGTLVLSTGIAGNGLLQVNAGATASLAGAPAANTEGLLAQNGTLATVGRNITVSKDYTNANFGVGNAFNKNAGVTGGGQILASGNTAQAITGAAVVNGSSATPTLNLGQFHIATAAMPVAGATASFNVANTGTSGPSLRGAIQTNGSIAVLDSMGSAAGNFGPVATGGQSGGYTVSVAPTAAGAVSGTFHVANNFANVAEQTVTVNGTGYNYAQATITPAPVSFGNVHVGSTATQALSIGNTAPAGSFTERLDGSAGGATGAATVTGSFTALAAGGNSTAVTVGLNTATAGAKTGTATVNFTSNAAGVDTLGNTALAAQTISVSGAVYNLASSNTLAPVTFGVLHVGTGVQARTLSITNTAPTGAFSEGLDSTFGAYTNTGGTVGVTASGQVINLAAGSTNSAGLLLSVNTTTAGTVNGTIQVHQASNGTIDGLVNTALADQNPAVSGTVQATVTNLAQAQINNGPVAFGNVRIGSTQATALSITNTAPTGGFSESLVANTASGGAGTAGGATLAGGFGLGSGTAVPSLAPQATDGTHVTVGLNTSTAGAKAGTATIDFKSDGTAFSGGTVTDLGTTNVAVTANVYRLASPTLNTPTLTLAARVGGSASGTVSVTNTSPDVYTEGLKVGIVPPSTGPFTATGSIANLAAGATDASSIRLALSTGTAGSFTTNQTVTFTSTGAGTDSATDLALTAGNVTVTGRVHQVATASVTPAVNFGTVHVGDMVTPKAVTVGNTATGALVDSLTGGFGIVTGPFTGTGVLGTGVISGGTSTALQVGLNTATAGVFAGTAGLSLASHDGDLADVSVGGGPVSLSGTVNNFAVSGYGRSSGAGSFTSATNNYTLDFGTVAFGSSLSDMLFAANLVVGPADILSGAFSVISGSGFGLTGFNSFGGLAAGMQVNGLQVSFNTSVAGAFQEVIDLMGIGSNSSGYSGAVTDTLLTLRGTVLAAGGGGTPVPEPGTLAVLASGIAGLFGLRRLRRARAVV